MAAQPPVAAEEQPLEPLTYQTWVLKVSIHCEGCKRKVKRILRAIEGVYMISIDSKQQKVTVTGNIEPETLIKKLMRTGKHAEMWPTSPYENEQKPRNDKPKGGADDDSDGEDSDQGDQQPPTEQQHGVRFILGGDQRPHPGMMMQMGPPPSHALPPPANGNAGGGSGGKKKKKKKKKKSGTGGANPPGPGGAPPGPTQGPGPGPLGGMHMVGLPACAGVQYQDLNAGNPNHNTYPSQGHYPNHPSQLAITAPVYSMSYSAIQPARSYGPYYHPQAMQPYSYAYAEPEAFSTPADTFDMINDENPNSCSVM
ncbi:hypothetical protein QQ045_006531 [Rhodiola kirilowii]